MALKKNKRANLSVLVANASNAFTMATNTVFSVILLFISITLIIGTIRLFFRIGELVQAGGITGNYLYVFSDVLTLFVLVELSRSLFEYFSANRLRLTFIVDAGIVFVLRDTMIALFEHKLVTEQIYAYAFLILVLGIVRASTVYIQPSNP